jgi:gp16 family phage-associated protein
MKTPLPRFQSPEACAAWLRANGVNVSQLARDNGLPRLVLVDLLRGKRKGHRGQAHRAAVLLGLKDDPSALQLAA